MKGDQLIAFKSMWISETKVLSSNYLILLNFYVFDNKRVIKIPFF